MLSFFPEMYPDELLYSVFARYHKFSGNRSESLSYSELLGFKSSVSCNPAVLPRNLEYLSTQVRGFGVSYNELLYQRTLFPYINLFASDRQMRIAEAWAFSLSFNGTNLKLAERNCVDTNIGCLKYCPICLEEEYRIHGEAYWHRHHQIPGVVVCTKHCVALQNSQITPSRYFQDFHSLEKMSISSSQNARSFNADDMKVAIQLANGIQWLFDNFDSVHKLWEKNIGRFQEVYFYMLVKKGFVTKHRVILISQFTRDIVRYYGKILSFFDLTFSSRNSYSWPTRVFLSEAKEIEPIRHFLMMQYLSGSIQNFFSELKKLKPYGFYNSPSFNYYFATESSLFNRDKEKFRNIWQTYSSRFYRQPFYYLNRKSLSALSWLYIYDRTWFANNRETNENIRDTGIFIKEQKTLEKIIRRHRHPFSISRKQIRRYEQKCDLPTARNNKRIHIKSLLETKTAYRKWKLSHRAKQNRVSVCSGIFKYTILRMRQGSAYIKTGQKVVSSVNLRNDPKHRSDRLRSLLLSWQMPSEL